MQKNKGHFLENVPCFDEKSPCFYENFRRSVSSVISLSVDKPKLERPTGNFSVKMASQ